MAKVYGTITIIVAHDSGIVIEGLISIIKKDPALEVIGHASTGEELLKFARKLKPDIIITDVKLRKLNGIEATKKIKKELPRTNVLALASYDEEDIVAEMLKAGAKGFLFLKNAHEKEIIKAIKAIHNNEAYFCNDTNEKLTELITKAKDIAVEKVKERFTTRERQVIKLICKGLPSKMIADQLGIKTRTVERYRDSIMEKMGVKNVSAVMVYAFANKLCSFPK